MVSSLEKGIKPKTFEQDVTMRTQVALKEKDLDQEELENYLSQERKKWKPELGN